MKEYLYYVKRTTQLFWDEKKHLMIGYVLMSIIVDLAGFINVATISLLVNKIENSIKVGTHFSEITGFVLFLGVMFALPYFLQPLMDYYDKVYRYHVENKLILLRAKKWTSLDSIVKDSPENQDLLYRVTSGGGFGLYQFLFRNMRFVSVFMQVALSSLVIIHFSGIIFMVIILSMLPELFVFSKYSNSVWSIWHAESPVRRYVNVIYEILMNKNNAEEIRVNRTKDALVNRMQQLYDTFNVSREKIENKIRKYSLLARLLSQGAIVFAFFYIFKSMYSGEVQIGTSLFYVMSLLTFRNSLALSISTLSSQISEMNGVRDFYKYIDLKPLLLLPDPGVVLEKGAPLIEFKNVTFHYPYNPILVFKNLSVTLYPGEKIAIVGINGAGKSTLIKLLLRFYDPTQGDILINGVSLKDVNLDSYYRLITVLFQDYIKYKFTARETIAATVPHTEVNEQELFSSAKQSSASEFIEQYEKQYETQLGKEFVGGVEPSGGQWQKIAMAGTFYKQAKLFILDEPTAAVDADAEEKIFDSLAQLPSDIGVILISHRFSTVRRADRIIVLEEGKIIEQGSHEELLKIDGRYKELFTKQAKGYQ